MVGILADMVRTNLKLPLPKVLCSTQTQEVMHADQVHLEMFSPLKHFAHQYPMEEEFYKKYGSSAVDLAISYLNKNLTVPVNVGVALQPAMVFSGSLPSL